MVDTDSKVSLAWANVHLDVSEWSAGLKVKKKSILRQLTGSCCTGTLTGLLGPSGAGKTTLLNVLSGSQTSGLTDSSAIYCNEKCPTSYYIPQHITESIVGELTVRQILQYAYAFKNGLSSTVSGQMDAFIERTLTSLLLDDSILDTPFSRCSGGEQKRVAIAQELMAHQAPTFLLLDEPTTGLDSAAAYEVISSLSALSRTQSITVIASIHAPNDETLCLFDQLYVLAKGGVAIYSGPPEAIRGWLEEQLHLPIPPGQPPIEALLKVASSGSASPSVLQLAASQLQHQSSSLAPPNKLPLQSSGLLNGHKAFSITDLYLNLCRLFRITFLARGRALLLTLCVSFLYISLLSTIFTSSMTSASGCIRLNQTGGPPESCLANIEITNQLRENGFYLCSILLYTGVLTICTSAATFVSTIKAFRAEHRNGWYSWTVFYSASQLVGLLQISLFALFTATLAYFLSGQHSIDGYSVHWTRLGSYTFFMWLLIVYLQSMGQLIGLLLLDHGELAIFLSLIYYYTSSMVNGFFVDTEGRGNALLQEGSSLLGFKFISWGILYTIYGIDRCDWQTEFSSVFEPFYIDREAIGLYILRVFGNILFVRLLTAGVMFAKFKRTTKQRKAKTVPKDNESKESHQEETLKKLELLSKSDEGKIEVESETFQANETTCQMKEKRAQLSGKILLAWENVSLFAASSVFERGIGNDTNLRPILRHLNGQVCFGTLNALMGTSGAGKTSLLKVLNGQGRTKLSEGAVFHLSAYSHIQTCFITQDVSGHLMAGLTAKQLLTYASRLKNLQTGVDHGEIALKWLRELDLLNTANTKVEKCSGGERKRLAVALELTALAMPNCVCIDEPTSGLDSNSAEVVISVLHKLTRHHPTAIKGTYALFDNFKYTFFANNFFTGFILLQFSLSFRRECTLFVNEHRNGAYSCLAFYLAKSLTDLLPLAPTVLVYVAIIGHWYEALRPGIYWSFLLLFTLSILATQGQAHLLALLSRGSITVLIILQNTTVLFTILLSNFLLLYGRLHYVYKFLSNCVIGRFFFEGVILLQYGFGRCESHEVQITLYSMGLSDADYGHCLRMLLFNICLYQGLAICLLIYQANPRENGRKRVERIETFRRNLKSTTSWF